MKGMGGIVGMKVVRKWYVSMNGWYGWYGWYESIGIGIGIVIGIGIGGMKVVRKW